MARSHLHADILRAADEHAGVASKIAGVVLNPPLWAIACHRAAHFLWRNDMLLIPHALKVLGRVASGVEIDPSAAIGPGLLIVHGSGVTLESGVRIGPRATLFQGVGIGRRFSSSLPDGPPALGEEVTIYAGAKVLGPVRIGDRCRIGANAVVTRSFPDDTTITGVPGRSTGRYAAPSSTAAEGRVVCVTTGRTAPAVSAGAFACEGAERPQPSPIGPQ